MTRVKIKEAEHGYEIDIAGHADYCPGADIVCAAASMLAYTLIRRLRELPGGAEIDCAAGSVHIATRGKGEKVKETVETILAGYKLLAEKYPENVGVEGVERKATFG